MTRRGALCWRGASRKREEGSAGSLLANVEFELSPTSANGQFGDVPGSLGIPDFSAVFNHDVC